MLDTILNLVPYATWVFLVLAAYFAVGVSKELWARRRAALTARASKASDARDSLSGQDKTLKTLATERYSEPRYWDTVGVVLTAQKTISQIHTATEDLEAAVSGIYRIGYDGLHTESSVDVFRRLVREEALTRASSAPIYLDPRLKLGSSLEIAEQLRQLTSANEEDHFVILTPTLKVAPKWRANASGFLRSGSVPEEHATWIVTGTSGQLSPASVG